MKMSDVTTLVEAEEVPEPEPRVPRVQIEPNVPRMPSSIRRSSEADVVHRVGNLENYYLHDPSLPEIEGFEDEEILNQKRWELNHREAAIFLQEGENNDKFTTHPRSQLDVPAYLITHNVWFYILTFLASLALLCLALFEEPSVSHLSLPISVHASLELLCLTTIAIELVLRLRWLGIRLFLRHIRTMIKLIILLIMFIEAIVVISRQSNHIRITRALRPFFVLDTYYCRGARRFIRQMIQSLPPMIDMLVLLMFFILLFSMLGFYLFSGDKDNIFFKDLSMSFVNMFILMTSANFPDVMMPAYDKNRWIAFFFIVYICIELFLMMNLFLAVVYSAFMKYEKDKLRKLLIHRRKACASAFQLLVSAQYPDKLSARNFAGCMKYFRPRLSKRDVYLAFKALNVSHSGKLSEQEFMAVYDAVALKWQRLKASEIWSVNFRPPLNTIGEALYKFVKWRPFDYFIYAVIVTNLIWIIGDTIYISVLMQQPHTPDDPSSWIEMEHRFIWISVIFVAIYCTEALIKILGLGPRLYFASGWNVFDFVVTVVALLGVLFQLLSNSFYALIVLRPLRVLRLFKLKRRFRDIFGTLVILFSRMCSLGVVVILLYYMFAIIGMEFFASYTKDLINCCKNTSVEEYYTANDTDGHSGYYYLNNFENIFMSYVTLFELTVVNNWWIIMEGFAAVASPWSRVYFMVFYLIIMIVVTTTMAFILDAFIFRIKYREKMQGVDMDDHAIHKVDVALSSSEIAMCLSTQQSLTGELILQQAVAAMNTRITDTSPDSSYIQYRGERVLGKNDFSLKMYHNDVQEWLALYEASNAARERRFTETS